jgi:hypothetical protein
MIKMEIENILYKCVSSQIKTLKRRNVEYQILPQEFSVVQLQKSVQDNLTSFEVPTVHAKDVYSPKLAQLRREESLAVTPTPIQSPRITIRSLEPDIPPGPPYRPDNPPMVEPDPIQLPIDVPPTNPIVRNPEPEPPLIVDPILPPGGGGSGGAGVMISRFIGSGNIGDFGGDLTGDIQQIDR